MLRFKSLGSGSSGNATVVEASNGRPSRLLVDCGLGIRTLAQRLALAGLAFEDIDALFITHEHSDHIGCAERLALRHGIPVWMSEGTWRACGEPALGPLLRLTACGDCIDLGGLEMRPFAVPHDAQEPLQLRLSDGDRSLGIVTDLGHAPEAVIARLRGCQALLLECNHDSAMLAQSPYPAFLKHRIGGDQGHLSNAQAADLGRHLNADLKQVLAGHLSRQNNRPEWAEAALREALGDRVDIAVASASEGSHWITV